MCLTDLDCPACGGMIPCKGGGNTLCQRRHKGAQHIAFILDSYGGARTIVADKKSLKANVRHDEIACIVPNLVVHEPIAWGDIPLVIERARLEFEKWLETRPNLDECAHRAVELYRLRGKRHSESRESLDLSSIVET